MSHCCQLCGTSHSSPLAYNANGLVSEIRCVELTNLVDVDERRAAVSYTKHVSSPDSHADGRERPDDPHARLSGCGKELSG